MDRNKVKKRLFFWYSFLWIFLIIAMYLSYAVYFVDTTSTKSKWVGLFAGAIAILTASCKICEISFYKYKDKTLEKVTKYFQNGVRIFFLEKYKVIILVLLFTLFFLHKKMGAPFSISLSVGTIIAMFSMSITNHSVLKTSVRISKALEDSTNISFRLALNSGIVVSMFSIGIAIAVITILFHIFKDYQVINGYILGASFVSLLNACTNSISKKSCSNAIDIVSKYVPEISSYDRRNPLLLLRGISKSVFDVSTLSSDMVATFCAVLIATMTIGAMVLNLMGCFLPIILLANGLFASIIAILLIKINKIRNPIKTLYLSVFLSIIIMSILTIYCVNNWLQDATGLAYTVIIGSIGGFIISFTNSKYIMKKSRPIRNVAQASINGYSSTIIQLFKEGFSSVFLPILITATVIVLGFIVSQGIAAPLLGIYGISLAILGAISTLGIILSINAFAFVSNDSNVILKTYETEENEIKTQEYENILGDVGYYLIGFGKNFLNTSAIMTSILVLIAYTLVVQLEQVDLINPYVMFSILIGATIPFIFSSFIIGGTLKATKKIAFEVKKQIKNFPQILNYELRPDYETCVKISSRNSLIKTLSYFIVVLLITILIGSLLKEEALAGYIIGIILSSIGLTCFISNTSILARGARRYFAEEYKNATETTEYYAIASSNNVFATIKDLIVPILNSLIKFIPILILALAPFFVQM